MDGEDRGIFDDELKASYGPLIRNSMDDHFLLRALSEERKALRAAMTPTERELADLRIEVAELKNRLEYARRALDGDYGNEW